MSLKSKKSQNRKQFSTPLSVEHLLKVQAIYNVIRKSRQGLFIEMPSATHWFRMRYMRNHAIRTLGSIHWDQSDGMLITMSLNRVLFDDATDPILLFGVIHHEMCHMLLGPEAKHGSVFQDLESGWFDYWYYQGMKDEYYKSVKAVEGNCIPVVNE